MTVNDPQSGDRDVPVAGGKRIVRPFDAYDGVREDEIRLLRVLSVLLKRWRIFLGLPLAAAVLTGALSLMMRPTFTATSLFVPEARTSSRLTGGLAGLAGLTSQYGLSLGGGSSQSPRFYADVATSREILERLLLTRFRSPVTPAAPADSATLLQILGIRGRSLADSLQRSVRVLRKRLAVKVDNQTNIVTLSIEAKDATLAASIVNRLVEYLNDFNAQVRQSQARETRKFVEERVSEGERDLKDVEEELRTFYERNRTWEQSPELIFEEGRLRRQVEIRQEMYTTLRREYETARIDEVNDIPVMTVIDSAVPPEQRSWPKRTVLVVIALVLGFVVSTVWALGTEYLERARRDGEPDYIEFTCVLTRSRQEALQMLRRATRRRPRL